MVVRLGEVIYWACSTAGWLLFALTAYVWDPHDPSLALMLLASPGLLLLLFGRACLYVLAGK